MKSEKNIKELFLRIVILMLGLTIAHFGVTLFLLADLGADPFNVLIQGLFRFLGEIPGWPLQTHGNTHIAVCFLIIVVLLALDRSYIRIGTILCMIFGGPIIDIFTSLLTTPFSSINALWMRVIANGFGCVILAFGMTMVMKSEAGTGPNDLVAIVFSDKTKKNFGLCRIVFDILFVVIGVLLGGSAGIGTFLCAFIVGPVANIFLPWNERWIQRILGK